MTIFLAWATGAKPLELRRRPGGRNHAMPTSDEEWHESLTDCACRPCKKYSHVHLRIESLCICHDGMGAPRVTSPPSLRHTQTSDAEPVQSRRTASTWSA